MKLSRRQLLIAGSLGSLSLAAYSFHRGVRIPTLHWDPALPANSFELNESLSISVQDLIKTSSKQAYDVSFRAFAPEPNLILKSSAKQSLTLSVNNIDMDASLSINDELNGSQKNARIEESINGITRELTVNLEAGQTLNLQWTLPKLDNYTFASIGDTGGAHELQWSLQRAKELGARFLLHLGDFNYQSGDYENAIDLFHNSPLPVYITIGNHDFHENGAIYGHFLKEIGPLNNAFSIGKTRFVNIDTAANTLPFSAGHRGELLKALATQNALFNDTVSFTHRPLVDPLEESTHDIGSSGERDWLVRMLKKLQSKTLLSGHIHIYDRIDFDGIDNIIAGQGLGHQDLIVGKNHSFLAMGAVNSDGKVSYTKAALALPMELHCHPRIQPVKESLIEGDGKELVGLINKACKY